MKRKLLWLMVGLLPWGSYAARPKRSIAAVSKFRMEPKVSSMCQIHSLHREQSSCPRADDLKIRTHLEPLNFWVRRKSTYNYGQGAVQTDHWQLSVGVMKFY